MSRYAKELRKLYDKNGVLTPTLVVDSARSEKNPLHPAFEWRDPVAAEQYRLHQARSLIRAVKIDYEQDGQVKRSVRFVHCPINSQAEGEYHPATVVVQRPDRYAAALAELKQKLISAQNSLDELRQVAEQSTGTDHERLSMITIAIEALKTAGQAVSSLH